jgi:hypothetical protein
MPGIAKTVSQQQQARQVGRPAQLEMSTNETKSKSVNSGEVTTSITGDKITLSDEYKYHDYFNIINFASIVVIDILYIIYSTEWHKIGTNQLAQDANCTKIFTLMSSFTANYLLWDTLFVYIYPTCVMDDTSTKEKMAKGLYNEVDVDADKMKKMEEAPVAKPKHDVEALKKAKAKLEQRISEMETMTAEEKIEESVKKKKLKK